MLASEAAKISEKAQEKYFNSVFEGIHIVATRGERSYRCITLSPTQVERLRAFGYRVEHFSCDNIYNIYW